MRQQLAFEAEALQRTAAAAAVAAAAAAATASSGGSSTSGSGSAAAATAAAAATVAILFRGVVAYVNGFTRPPPDALRLLIVSHGGRAETFEGRGMTHIICEAVRAILLSPARESNTRCARIYSSMQLEECCVPTIS